MTRLISLAPILALAACSLPREAQPAPAPGGPGFAYLREERFTCGGQTKTVEIYRHELSGLEFVLIPGGEFLLGSPEGEEGRYDDEGPMRVVNVESFLLCRTEVTNQAYRKLRPEHDSGGWEGFSLNGDRQPVVGVSWEEAQAWCASMALRLPTDAEWEVACRVRTTTARFWGDDEEQGGLYANVADRTAMREWPAEVPDRLRKMVPGWRFWETTDGFAVTAPVASFKPNAYGLFDMIGNVWEWVGEARQDGDAGSPSLGDAASEDSTKRFYRGGSWASDPQLSRSARRGELLPGFRSRNVGFRPASSMFQLSRTRTP